MDQVDPGLREQFFLCVAEDIRPRFVHSLEITVDAGHANQVKGKIKQLDPFSIESSWSQR
jgi:hypothetical protein